MSYEAWFAIAIKFYHSENSLFTRWIDFCSIKILKILIKGDTMRWPEGIFESASQGDEKRGGEACWETDGERDGEIAKQRKSRTQGIFWETEKRIRPIGAGHDRVSDDGWLCISLCLHQRHRNTTHTHSASSYKHCCSPIKAAVSNQWTTSSFHGWGKPSSAGWSLARCLENGPRKRIMLLPIGGKKTDCDLINNLLRRHNSAKVKPLDRISLSGELNFILKSLSICDRSQISSISNCVSQQSVPK